MPSNTTYCGRCGMAQVPGLLCCGAATKVAKATKVTKLPKAGPPRGHVSHVMRVPGRATNVLHGKYNYGMARCTTLVR